MRVVLTGGGGFIGSYVLKSRYAASLVAAGDARFVRCDGAFGEDGVLRATLADADALVLLGYVMPTASSPADRLLEELERNVAPTVRLLRAAGDRVRQIVFASSVSVYGIPTHVPVRESDTLSPRTPYAIAKVACEQAIQLQSAASGARCAILRYSTVYGPGELVPRAIPNFIRAALAGQMPRIRGDGLDEHDYIHVADVAAAMSSSWPSSVCNFCATTNAYFCPCLHWLLGSIGGRTTSVEAFSGTDELAASCCRVSLVSLITSPLQLGC